jgi:hypothetical protein
MVTDMRSGLFFLTVLIVGMLAPALSGQSNDKDSGPRTPPVSRSGGEWLTGKELQSRLRGNIRATWSESPLPRVLDQISATQQVAFFLDRRVDKGLLVEYGQESGSVFQAIDQVVTRAGLSGMFVGDIYYVAAPEAIALFAVERERFREEASRLRGEAARWWLDAKTWSWPELSRPAELIGEHFPGQLVAADAAPFPHDLWPAFDGPELSRADMLLLILNGFGFAPQTEEGKRGAWSLRPVAPPADAQDVSYKIEIADDLNEKPSALLEEIRKTLPEAKIEARGTKWTVKASPVDLAALIRFLDLKRLARRDQGVAKGDSNAGLNSRRVVSLERQAPIIDILRTCARNLEVSLEFDEALRPALEKRIEIQVSRVTYEELIAETLKGTDLTWQLESSRLRILHKE